MKHMLATKAQRWAAIDEWWRQAISGLQAETERIKTNFRFYIGGDGQWDSEVIAELDREGRPHLSINKCKSTIDLLSGYQRKFRDSLDVFPRRGGTAQAARILTRLGRHTMDTARPSGDHVQSEMFMMGALGGKWWTALNTVYEHDLAGGDLQPESVSCFDMLEDPLFRGYDINSNDPANYCRYIFRCHAFTLEQLKAIYHDNPEITESIDAGMELAAPWQLNTGTDSTTGDDYEMGPELVWRPDYSSLSGRERRYWVRQCWYKLFQVRAYLLNTETGQVHPLGERVREAKALADGNPLLAALVRLAPVLRRADYLGEIELRYDESPLHGLAEYPFFRFCPYWINGQPLGELDNLREPQMELNKRRSQLLHHLNTSANSGWQAEEGSLSPSQLQNYQDNGSRAGFFGMYLEGKQPPDRIYPAPLAEGYLKLAMMSSDDFEDITKINDAVYGQTRGSKESGKALETRREQGLTVKEVAFDNFKFTELGFYMHMLERIRQADANGQYIYSAQEIMMLVEEHDLDIDVNILRSMETGRYGIKVSRSETQPTVRRQNFMELVEMLNAFPNHAQEIDIIDVLESSDLGNKEQLVEKIRQRRMELAQMQQQQMGMAQGVA